MKIDIAELTPFEGNARRGNVDVIAESLDTLGQYRPIVVNRGSHTGQPNVVLAGNHTLAAARRLGWNEIDCHIVDVDAEQARKIALVDNRSNDLATYDDDALAALLVDLESLTGTGFTDADLHALIDDPEFDPVDETNRVDVSAERTCPECGHTWREGPDGKPIT